MGYLRTAQPAALPVPGLKALTYGTATAMPFALSLNRKTVYGAALGQNTVLRQSVDDGVTWTSVHTFAEPVLGLRELDDGEALAYTQNGASTPGYIYRSSGWATSHTSATWTKVLTTTGGYIRAIWAGGHPAAFGDDTIRAGSSTYGVVCEYGAQTTSSGSQTTNATRVYFTSNYGATWTVVLDLTARYPGVYPLHTHGAAYDPYWDRLWVTHGDISTADGTTKAQILYSDDHGVTWAAVPLPADWTGSQMTQATAIAVLPHAVLFSSDNNPGVLRIPRAGYRVMADLRVAAVQAGGTSAQMLGTVAWRNARQPGAPVFFGSLSVGDTTLAPIFGSVDDGQTIIQLWEDSVLRDGYRGVHGIVGPTWSGLVLVWTSQDGSDPGSGTHWLLRAELVIPEPDLLDGKGTVTGNGSTTVFNFAHGLGVTPTRVMAWHEKPAGTYTVTATSTNIVVTFTTAPANAASIPFAWRAAA